MAKDGLVLVVGLGEIGRPLLNILDRTYHCLGVDIEPIDVTETCSVMHICYPYQIDDFEGTTVDYIAKYRPALTIVHSTVAPGTVRRVSEASGGGAVAYSPVRGKHARMEADMMRYKKFLAASQPEFLQQADEHLRHAGFKTTAFRSLELAELTKLLETTYLGLLVAWAQEVERFAARFGASNEEVNAFMEEIDYLPSSIFPGHIGGHCVMPNIEILRSQFESQFLDAIVNSNDLKREQLVACAATR